MGSEAMTKPKKSELKQLGTEEFIRRLKHMFEEFPDSKISFFIGAGCSQSSGIPTANTLVKDWLRKLKILRTGNKENLDSWIKKTYPDYRDEKANFFYNKTVNELFATPEERKREFEKLIEGKDPGFGYAILAQLMAHPIYGPHCNTAITTNFDDLIAEAFYFYTKSKPILLYQESLVGINRFIRNRPLVVKLKGDAQMGDELFTDPTSTPHQNVIIESMKNIIGGSGLVFIGYGGYEKNVAQMLENIPANAFPWGIYWVNDRIPDSRTGDWLLKRNAIWVPHLDFDELMLLALNIFKLSHPDEKRFKEIIASYFATLDKIKRKVDKRPERPSSTAISQALVSAIKQSHSWWKVEQEADQYKKSDPPKAESIYLEGLASFPNNSNLMTLYAVFLAEHMHDYENSDVYFKKAHSIDSSNAYVIENYAIFQACIRKDFTKAEKLFQRAIHLEPNSERFLCSYACLLNKDIRSQKIAKDLFEKAYKLNPYDMEVLLNFARFLAYDQKNLELSDKFYKKAIDLETNETENMMRYRFFLKNIRKHPDVAILYYDKMLKINPTNTKPLCSYANMLRDIRENYDEALKYYELAANSDPDDPTIQGNYGGLLIAMGKPEGFDRINKTFFLTKGNRFYDSLKLECFYYIYAHSEDENARRMCLEKIKRYLLDGIRSPGWNPAANFRKAVMDDHPEPAFLSKLGRVISGELSLADLKAFNFLKDERSIKYLKTTEQEIEKQNQTKFMESDARNLRSWKAGPKVETTQPELVDTLENQEISTHSLAIKPISEQADASRYTEARIKYQNQVEQILNENTPKGPSIDLRKKLAQRRAEIRSLLQENNINDPV
jgi:tetratricopeptide (TPR) repeat protein